MNITVVSSDRDITFNLSVQNDLTIEDFKALCSVDLETPPEQIVIIHKGIPLRNDKQTLGQCGFQNDDMVLTQKITIQHQPAMPTNRPPQSSPFANIDFSKIMIPGAAAASSSTSQQPPQQHRSPVNDEDPAIIRRSLLENERDLALLRERNPELAEAVNKGDKEFAIAFNKIKEARKKAEMERIRMINADPFDEEVQKKIAEEIKMNNIQENMNMAIEESPESFGQVYMLWINCEVNGHTIKAFVDSGAQMTIMSSACAERCNIMRLVDKRWEGIAKGVGVQKIIGRVHLAQLQIANDFLPCSYSVLEDQPMDMLLGLDMLKRHQCVIDLKENILKIGTTGTITKFLSESEIPSHGRLHDPTGNNEDEKMDIQSLEDQEMAKALQRSKKEVTKGAALSQAKPAQTDNAPQTSGDKQDINVKKLTDMGFSQADAVKELRNCDGNLELAIVKLAARSLKPK